MPFNPDLSDYPLLGGYTGLVGVTAPYYGDFNSPGDPFLNAAAYLGVGGSENITSFVQGQIDFAEGIVDESKALAFDAISALKGIQLLIPDHIIPILPAPNLDFTYDPDYDPVNPPSFGSVDNWTLGGPPDYEGDRTITVPKIPDFDPSYTSLYIPPAPPYVPPKEPGDPPEVGDPEFPPAPPDVPIPVPGFSQINLPPTPDITIPDFVPEFPEFDLPPPPVAFDWTEPVYTREIIDSILAQIETFLAGGTGIRPDVQEALFNRASEREDRIAVQSIQEVTDEYAARGYTLPPGLLSKRIAAIRLDRDLKKQGISREILIKAMDVEIENLRFAVTAGIQAEELFVRLFLAAAERSFLAVRLAVEYSLQLYSYLVEVFKVRQEEVKTRAMVYEAQVRAALGQIEIYKAQIEGELAKVQIDQAKVDLYKGRIEAEKVKVEKYEAQIRAEATKLEAARIQIQGYAALVDVYVAQVNAQKLKFDAYDSRIRGELGKASIVESEARAYAAEIQGIGTGVNAEARSVEAQTGIYAAEIQAYVAESESLSRKGQIQLGRIQAQLAGYQAYTQRYNSATAREEAQSRLELAAWDSVTRNQLGYYQTQIAKYELDARLLTEQARIALGAASEEGGLASTIIGGALAAMHVGASISGSGSISANGTRSDAFQTSKSISDSVNVSNDTRQTINYNIDADGGTDSIAQSPPWFGVE